MTTFTNPTTPTTTGNNVAGKAGERIQWSSAVSISTVTKSSSSTATHCYIQTAWGSGVLATAAFSGNVATFNYSVSASTDYWILCDKEGSTYDAVYNNSASKPTGDGIATWQAGVNQAGQESSKNYSRIILNIVAVSDVTVSPSAFTLSTSSQAPAFFINISQAAVFALTTTAQSPTVDFPGPNPNMGTIGSKEIMTRYPVAQGLIANTTSQTGQYRRPNLVAQEETSF